MDYRKNGRVSDGRNAGKKIAAGVVETGKDLLEWDEQIKERNYYIELDHPDGRSLCENITINLSRTPGRVGRAGPSMGHDNEYVYKKILGMSENEVNQCYVDGTFD